MIFEYLKICQLDPLSNGATYLFKIVNPQENIFEHSALIQTKQDNLQNNLWRCISKTY